MKMKYKTKLIDRLKQEAERDNPDAQLMLGDMYCSGDCVEQDKIKAAYWYNKAANHDKTRLQALVKLIPAKYGDGSIEELANEGYAAVQLFLGKMYYNGVGVETNLKKAALWCHKAANQGYVWAQIMLGNLYIKGHGVKQSTKKARKWYRKAALQGNAEAQFRLGCAYYEDEKKDLYKKKAIKWLQEAVEQGYSEAPCYLCKIIRN